MVVFCFVACLLAAIVISIFVIVIEDERIIRSEEDLRRCTMTDCYFNSDLMCRSLSDTWNPDLLDNCPDYAED